MPKYDRQCNECDELFEVISKIADKDEPKECPYCGSTDGAYHISAPHFTMRGDRLMTQKQDNGFKEVLDKIKERNPRTEISKR